MSGARERSLVARPARVPFPATRVIKALPVKVLSSGRKLVWLEIYALDSGAAEGCFMGATPLARRLGVSADQVEQDRRELLRLGLLETASRVGRRTSCWFPVVPASCLPIGDRPGDEEVRSCADRLVLLLGSPAGNGGADSAGVSRSTGVVVPAIAPPTGGAGSAGPPILGVVGSAGVVPDWRSLLRPVGFQPLRVEKERGPTSEGGAVFEYAGRVDPSAVSVSCPLPPYRAPAT